MKMQLMLVLTVTHHPLKLDSSIQNINNVVYHPIHIFAFVRLLFAVWIFFRTLGGVVRITIRPRMK